MSPTAAIITVGSELTGGLRVDTNTAEIAHALAGRGITVHEATSVPDEETILAAVLERLSALCDVVVVTGGLGPTHDDVTRQAASEALGLPLARDERLERLLQPAAARHSDPDAAAQILVQADVLAGAEVIDPTTGTAPGQIVASAGGLLALLPGPPAEMRPMLALLLERLGGSAAPPRELGIVGMTESDVQVRVQRAISGLEGVGFTVLARPGDVRAVFTDTGGGASTVEAAATSAAAALGDACYSSSGESLSAAVVRVATERGVTVACAESCTGGMVCAALTDVPGSSAALLGGVVSYSDAAKVDLLGVNPGTLRDHGAVSAQTVREMASGAQRALASDLAVSISGVAGPGGGTEDKPIGTVWFGLSREASGAQPALSRVFLRHYGGDRAAIRLRATSFALDLLRRAVLDLSLPE